MSGGRIIGPGAVQVPAGLSFVGLELPGGAGPLPLRDLYILAALHALASRESMQTSSSTLGCLAVRLADAALAARSASPATPPALAAPGSEG